jgi:hypothetical protein
MALIIPGKTICPICQEVLHSHKDVYGFPAFIPNVKDKLYIFNDEACHKTCLENHIWGNQAMQLALEFQMHLNTKVCAAGGNIITNPDDYIFLPLLTSDDSEELYRFNFTTLDRNNTPAWRDRQRFISVATEFIHEGKWQDAGNENSNYLESIVQAMALTPS